MPKAVSDWIRKSCFESNSNAYFVLTCGGSVGNAAAYIKKLCKEKKLQFRWLALVVMPNNYVALSSTSDKEECAVIMRKVGMRLSLLSVLIEQGKSFPEAKISLKDRMNSGLVCELFYACCVQDKGFSVSDGCTSCGKCAARCPLNNIYMKDGKPAWNGNCTHCMACIGDCPTEAVEYKSASKGKR